jgi:ribosomal protein S21
MKRKNFKNNFRSSRNNTKPISGVLTVTAEECGGNIDKMVRKFNKKAKTSGIIEEFRNRTHYVKPSDIKREDNRKRKRTIEKVNRQREELFTTRDPWRSGSRKRRK